MSENKPIGKKNLLQAFADAATQVFANSTKYVSDILNNGKGIMRNFVSTAVLLTAIATPLVFVDPALAHSNGNGKTYLNTQDLWRQSMNNNDTVERWNGRQGSSPIYYHNDNECRDHRDNNNNDDYRRFVKKNYQYYIIKPSYDNYTKPNYDSYLTHDFDDNNYYTLGLAPDDNSSFRGIFWDKSHSYSSHRDLVAVFRTDVDQHGECFIALDEQQTRDRFNTLLNMQFARTDNNESVPTSLADALKSTAEALSAISKIREIECNLDGNDRLYFPDLTDSYNHNTSEGVLRRKPNAPNYTIPPQYITTPSGKWIYVPPAYNR
ncbi:MAG: hypothetical protein PHX43_04100 [Alphaproteobacteria bacterium]|nr:hypothetical protein [Alphaproteobacteria bacterium]